MFKPTFQFFKTGKCCNSFKLPQKLFHFPDFQTFATFNLLGYISEITMPVCEIDSKILVSVMYHDAIFTTRTS